MHGPEFDDGAAASPAEAEPTPEARPRPRILGRDLLLVLLLTVAVLVLVGTLIGDPALTVGFVIVMLVVQSAIPMAAVWLVIVKGRGVSWAEIGLRPAPPGWSRRAALLALATVPLIALVNFLTGRLTGGPIENPQIDVLAPEGFTWTGFLGILAVAAVVAPIVEEIVFRGLLYGWLRARAGVVAGTVLSALAFALAHGIPALMPAFALQGAILAAVYERSGSLWPAIVLHGTFNAVMVVLLYGALAAGIASP